MITKAYNRIKSGILWVKNNPRRVLPVLLGIGFVGAAPALFPGTTEQNKNDILPITFNDKTISFSYTDDNTGETLIIKTDQQTYSSWDSAYVHFAVKNITNNDQSVKVQFAYDGGASTSKVEEFKPQVAYQVEVPIYQKKTYECKEGWTEYTEPNYPFGSRYVCKNDPKTARFCNSVTGTTCTVDQEQTGTTPETRYRDEWGTILKDTVEDLKYKDVKPIDAKFVTKEQVTYWIPAGATKYFRAKLQFTPKSNGEFYINAYGSLNAVGHLDPWYSSSWGYRRQITLDYTKVGTTTPITGIPLMYSTSTIADLKFTSYGGKVGKSDGTDILVTASDGTTKIPHELEFYSSSTGETVLHFISSTSTPLSTSTNTSYYLYYGNSGASDQQDTANVWDSYYKGVWHMKNGTTLSAEDSTSNNNDFTHSTPTATTGKIDGAANYTGTNDQSYYAQSTMQIYTYSAWVKMDATPSPTDGGYFLLGLTETDTGTATGWSHLMGIRNTGAVIIADSYVYDGSVNRIDGTTSLSSGSWYYITATVYQGVNQKIYVNGALEGTASVGTLYDGWSGGPYLGISKLTNAFIDYGFSTRLDGQMDEVRFSNGIARSADWIKTEYNNQSSPNTFWSVGAEETDTPAAAPSTRRILIIE